MITFKQYLNESIIVGKFSGQSNVVILSPQKKHLFVFGATEPNVSPHVSLNFIPTSSMLKRMQDVVMGVDLRGAPNYGWSDRIEAALESMPATASDFDIVLGETNLIPPTNADHIFREYLQKTIANTGMQTLQTSTLFYGKPLTQHPKYHAAQNDPELYKKVIASLLGVANVRLSTLLTGGSYIFVNHIKKTIEVIDNTKKYDSRMGTIGGKSTYILPLYDFSIDERTLVNVLRDMIKYDKNLRSYTVPDVYIATPIKYSAGDIVDGIGRIAQNAAQFDNKHRGKAIKVYHGTSLALYNNSISKYGLQANKGVEYADKIRGHSEHNVYFTHSLAEARKYAVRAGGGRGSVVLEVEIHDLSRLVFDEDQLGYGLSRIPQNVLNEIKMRLVQLWPNQHIITHQFNPDIPFSEKRIDLWALQNLFATADTPAKRNVLSLIGNYAIGSANTFAYRGQIPPRHIKVVETFKSTTVKDADPDYGAKYDKVIGTFKSVWR